MRISPICHLPLETLPVYLNLLHKHKGDILQALTDTLISQGSDRSKIDARINVHLDNVLGTAGPGLRESIQRTPDLVRRESIRALWSMLDQSTKHKRHDTPPTYCIPIVEV